MKHDSVLCSAKSIARTAMTMGCAHFEDYLVRELLNMYYQGRSDAREEALASVKELLGRSK